MTDMVDRALKYLLPYRYWEDDFVQQYLSSVGQELNQLDRWTQIERSPDLENVLAGETLYQHEGILNQWFARMATGQGLAWWENMLGIPSDTTLTDLERQQTLLARMKSRTNAPTPDIILSIVEQWVTRAVVLVDIADYSFTITIIEPRAVLPAQIQNYITTAVGVVKPAHLAYTIIFTEEAWNNLANRTWADIGNASWSTLNY